MTSASLPYNYHICILFIGATSNAYRVNVLLVMLIRVSVYTQTEPTVLYFSSVGAFEGTNN